MTEQSEKKTTLLYSQDKYINSPYKFPAIVGTWGCGKSLAGLYAANLECENHQDNLYLVMRKEFVDLRDSTMNDWATEIGSSWDGDKNVHYHDSKSTLMFRHGNDIKSLKNTNLGGALLIQAEEMTEEEFWFVVGRLRRKTGSLKLRIEANYDGHNWIYRIWKKREINIPSALQDIISPADFHLVETNTLENKENLPPAYIASLEMLPALLKRRHYLGSWEDAEGLVYDEFNEQRHVVEPFDIPEQWERGLCLDHGFRNPTAVLWYAIDYDGCIVIYDEHYKAGMTVSAHSEEIKKRGMTDGIADPSIFNKTFSKNDKMYSIADEYDDFGINLRPATRSKEDASIARVNEFFKGMRIKIFKNCVNTIEEVSNWKWKEIKPGINAKEEPQDLNNHACDVVKYIVASRFPSSVVPSPKTEPGSLKFYEEQDKYNKELEKRRNGDKTW